MLENLQYELKNNHDEQSLFTAIQEHYATKTAHKTKRKCFFFDTFDWRLYNKSLSLFYSGDMLTIQNIDDGCSIVSITCSSMPIFVWDLPDSTFRRKLEPILEMRALLKIFELQTVATPIRILNEDEKTVAYLTREEVSILPQNKPSAFWGTLYITAVRGYEAETQHVVQILENAGLSPCKESLYKRALVAASRHSGDYSTKLNLTLQPDMHADEAAKAILRFLLKVMKQNEEGMKRDIDTEFLHDFRVATRRTRSALSQIKHVFSEEITTRFRNDFSNLGKSTNPLRDLDVYLLNAGEYKKMLPPQLRADIDPLFENLQKQRKSALQNVIALLDSPEYAKVLHDWQAFLNQPPTTATSAANAAVPVITLAQKRIYKRFRLIVKTGNEITDASDDRLLHSLRIECKKLRYLLEFFSSLFEQEKVAYLVKQLKKLQDNLGRFQDLCVQEKELQSFIDKLSLKSRRARKTIAAIGSLIGALDREKQTMRAHFAKIFTEFASDNNKQSFKKLFKTKVNEGIA